MSEFFLELFSEEIPAGLQKNLREKIFEDFKNLFEEKSIRSKKNFSFSTPNRLVLVFEGLDKQIKIKSKEIRGPKTNLFGVEKAKFFFDFIDFSSNKFLKSSKIFSLKFF